MTETKSYTISKNFVVMAFEQVKANQGTYGVDRQTVQDFESNKKNNLYKLWNRMSSGSYMPKPVRAVEIPKKSGGKRILGIPTIEDRTAQSIVKLYFEPAVETLFYEDSYGYRPNKSAIQAIEATKKRCWQCNWVLEFDIKGLFDSIRHDYLLEMVKRHSQEKWVILYIQRWLKAPFQLESGELVPREAGTPQGGVISPVLANLYLHYAFDEFMMSTFKHLKWARYADDGIVHCMTLKQAEYVKKKLEARLRKFGLELHEEKTKIIYCKDVLRGENYANTSFDFLGYTFRTRAARSKSGNIFARFLPAMSDKAKKAMRKEIRNMRLQSMVSKSIQEIAVLLNPKVQGWINYYAHFYKSELREQLAYINQCLVKWVRKKYRKSWTQSIKWITTVARSNRNMFAQWKFGSTNDWVMGAV